MKYIGAHVDGYPAVWKAPIEAASLGAGAFALNITDPSRFRSPEISDEDADRFINECSSLGFAPAHILPHAGFVVNLASPEAQKLKLSRMAMTEEMKRACRLNLNMVNFHPGAHLNKISEQEAIQRVGESLNIILEATDGVVAVIENTAGQGSNLGWSFAQLAEMIRLTDDKSRVGVCIDSAHAFAAGYDLSTDEGYDACWNEFEETVGFDKLRGMHINDSMRAVASRIDRHAPVGRGFIGEHFFRRLMADERFDGIPLILETPDPSLWAEEIALLYSWIPEK